MQIVCKQCHRPFAIGKEAVYQALEAVTAENLVHYNVHCPHCRRINRVSRADLQRAAPDWKKKEDAPA